MWNSWLRKKILRSGKLHQSSVWCPAPLNVWSLLHSQCKASLSCYFQFCSKNNKVSTAAVSLSVPPCVSLYPLLCWVQKYNTLYAHLIHPTIFCPSKPEEMLSLHIKNRWMCMVCRYNLSTQFWTCSLNHLPCCRWKHMLLPTEWSDLLENQSCTKL